jgi:16S rRNA (guanine1207-N2)-methyltransferase
MSALRLELAFEAAGLASLDGGGIYNATLPNTRFFRPENTRAEQGFYPDHLALAKAGYAVAPRISGPFRFTVVCLPRFKAAAQDMIDRASAATEGGLVFVDGQKTEGIESLFKATKRETDVLGSVTKAHGRCFWFPGGARFEDWTAQPLHPADGFETRVGVFSADKVDAGSKLLVQHLPPKLPARVADFGAGWGYLAKAILQQPSVQELDLIEADHAALDCARLNVQDARAVFQWADIRTFTAPKYDAVLSNPPFHTGRAGDPSLGQAFIERAARLLKSHGTLWMVANRHLPYEDALQTHFQNVTEIGGDGRFKVIEASRPRTRR